jgi:ubiquinone/menaquinone biosynthesis C-methylase UbiE
MKSGEMVLDVGTGTGIFLPYLSKEIGEKGKIIALDIAEKMLSKAKSKGITGNIDFVCGDVMSLPFPDDFCDTVVCYSCLPHFPDKVKAMQEIRRTLKKGGQVFICHTSGRHHINSIHTEIPGMAEHILPDAIEMTKMLAKAGFTDIKVEDKIDSYFASALKKA